MIRLAIYRLELYTTSEEPESAAAVSQVLFVAGEPTTIADYAVDQSDCILCIQCILQYRLLLGQCSLTIDYLKLYVLTLFVTGASHYDGLPQDLSSIFDPHWGKFPPQVGQKIPSPGSLENFLPR